jgi:hypothetical protein
LCINIAHSINFIADCTTQTYIKADGRIACGIIFPQGNVIYNYSSATVSVISRICCSRIIKCEFKIISNIDKNNKKLLDVQTKFIFILEWFVIGNKYFQTIWD